MSDTGRNDRRGIKRSSRDVQQNSPRRPVTNVVDTQHNIPSTSQVVQGSGETPGGNAGFSRGLSRTASSRTQPTANENQMFFGRMIDREIITRPSDARFNKCGTEGSTIDVKSNYFHLTKRPDMKLLQYRVDFTPEIENRRVQTALIGVHEKIIGKYIFDGTLLYNTKKLPQPLELMSTRTSDQSQVKINIRFTAEIQKEDPVYTSVTNLILNRCMAMLNLVLIRRNFYDKEAREDVQGHPITIWPGYLTTIRHHEQDYFMNVEVIHKFLRRDTAFDVLYKFQTDKKSNEPQEEIQKKVVNALVGKIVMTGYNNRTYRIDDVDFVNKVDSTFHLRKEDRHITYLEYYQTRYQLKIRYLNQPLLVSRPSNREKNRCDQLGIQAEPIYLIPELCGMTGLSDNQRKDHHLTRAVSTITRVAPDRRVETLLKFRRRLTDNPKIQQEMNSWGLQFSNELVNCKARILTAKPLITGAGRINVREGDWSRDMQKNKMSVSVKLREWIVIHPKRSNSQIRHFVQLIQRVGHSQGFHVPEPRYVALETDRINDYIRILKDHVSKIDYDIVMCLMQKNDESTYAAIKKFTFCEWGIPSQVITGRILNGDERRQLSVATKVMTQIACKLGAEPWKAQVPNKPWMIIGYDTFHDAKKRTAVGAFVASTNPNFTRYNSSVKIHEADEEISPSFRQHMTTALKAYYLAKIDEKCLEKRLPENIIIYRDGVGAGDIQTVLDVELKGIKDACRDAGQKLNLNHYDPGISFVIVTKKINTRFFYKGRDKFENPPCGMVVDNTITLSEHFDFFLVSQRVNQGTVSPTKFNVIYNTSNITPDIHQSLAYALTHVYYNWAGTVRVPAPIQYAHKLAYLVGEKTEREPNDNLAKFPYYL